MKRYNKRIFAFWTAMLMLLNIISPTTALAAGAWGKKEFKGTLIEPNYTIRVVVQGVSSTNDVPSVEKDGSVYVRVKYADNAYGFVKLTDSMKTMATVDGQRVAMFEVPVSNWVKADGGTADVAFTGNEENISVQLVYYPDNYSDSITPSTSPAKRMEIGEYINNAKITRYPTGSNDEDRDVQDDDSVIDYIRLSADQSHLSSYSLEFLLTKYNVITFL